MVGDNTLEKTYTNLEFYLDAGIKVIEIGVPFSDPTADGDTIQKASTRALNCGTNINHALNLIKRYKKKYPDVSFILMSYLNPILQLKGDTITSYPIDGLVIPDLPVDEQSLLTSKYGLFIPLVNLIPVNTPRNRIKEICELSSCFIYLVASIGTTGSANESLNNIHSTLSIIREYTSLPVVIGFGISTKKQIEQHKKTFDGIVIGSHFVRLMSEGKYEDIKKLL